MNDKAATHIQKDFEDRRVVLIVADCLDMLGFGLAILTAVACAMPRFVAAMAGGSGQNIPAVPVAAIAPAVLIWCKRYFDKPWPPAEPDVEAV